MAAEERAIKAKERLKRKIQRQEISDTQKCLIQVVIVSLR